MMILQRRSLDQRARKSKFGENSYVYCCSARLRQKGEISAEPQSRPHATEVWQKFLGS